MLLLPCFQSLLWASEANAMFINWELMREPINWFIVVLMVTLGSLMFMVIYSATPPATE